MAAAENPHLSYDLASEIFQVISITRCQGEWQDLIDKAVTYARVRVDWLRCSKEQQRQRGPERSARHDAFIASCDAMAQAMTAAGEDTRWQSLLGTDRKTIGDFACFVHCILGQMAR